MPDRPAPAPRPRRVALTLAPDELLDALRRAGYAFPPDTALTAVFERREADQVLLVVSSPGYAEVPPGAEATRYPSQAVLAGEIVIAMDAAARAGGVFVHRAHTMAHAIGQAEARRTGGLGTPPPLPGQGQAAAVRTALRTADRLRANDRDAGFGTGLAPAT